MQSCGRITSNAWEGATKPDGNENIQVLTKRKETVRLQYAVPTSVHCAVVCTLF